MNGTKPNTEGPIIGVVGATGMVGGELLRLLERRRFPAGRLFPFASERSRGRLLGFRGRRVPVLSLGDGAALGGCDLVFFVSDKELSKKYAPSLADRGAWVIDDSSAFRLDPDVPLVVPEVNAASLRKNIRLVAGPNCAATPIAMAADALGRRFGLRSIRASTYQSASGWGKAALEELSFQARTWARTGKIPRAKVLPQRLFMNLFPHIDSFDASGYTLEELKIAAELKKILSRPGLSVTATAVRVPVPVGHSASVWIETERPVGLRAARKALSSFPGVVLVDDPGRALYPTPMDAAGKWPVFVGRVRQGSHPREILLWLSADNLLKGAALNSVQIAEIILKKGWLRSKPSAAGPL